MRFVDDRRAFELSRFVLPEAAARGPALAAEARRNGERNPPVCLSCHGEDPRPIFDSYPLWPGFFGAVRDTFPAGSPDLAPYRAFLDGAARDRRLPYAQLSWPSGTAVPPYTDPAGDDPRRVRLPAAELAHAPNTRLGIALSELNRRRIGRKLEAAPAYRALRRPLLARLLDCLPDDLPAEELRAVEEQLRRESLERRARLGLGAPTGGEPAPAIEELKMVRSAALVRATARRLGVGSSDWSMALDDDSLSAYDGVLGADERDTRFLRLDVVSEMLRSLAADEPRFAPFVVPFRAFSDQAFGERLDLDAARKACALLVPEAARP